jgi:excisionase family DNA binding protein
MRMPDSPNEAHPEPTELLTEAEAAARLRIGERTLRDIRNRGEIPYVRIGMRKIFYRAKDCENYIASRLQNDTPPRPTMRRTQRRRAGDIIPFSELMDAKGRKFPDYME